LNPTKTGADKRSHFRKLKIRENMTGSRINTKNPAKLGRMNRYPAIASFSELFNLIN